MAIIITNYSEKYRDDVRNICLDTAGSNAREEKSMRFLLATFCDYYIEHEAEHCFIAVDEDTDTAIGYILCAPDYKRYKRIFKAEYLPRVKGCKKGDIIESWASVNGPALFARSYPAHMHINIKPGYQRCGLGTKLFETLIAHLKELGSKGIMLVVDSYNTNAINFYKKNKFDIIFPLRVCTVMARRV